MGAPKVIGPGGTLGVFGGGQLGRMFAKAAARLGYRVIVYAPEPGCPASHVSAEHICAPYADADALRRFARMCDAVTIEFENVPAAAVETVAALTPVRPGAAVLAIAQDRLAERAFLDRHGFPCAPHAPVRDAEQARQGAAAVGAPGVLKTARLGYDGRGQAKVGSVDQAPDAWASLNTDAALYESWVHFGTEVSVLVARSEDGRAQAFGPIENHHERHILDCSVAPASLPESVASDAVELARAIADAIGLVGLLCVEMFVLTDGSLMVNELAPRPHNSGHLTIEACCVSQFEQQVRAVCGLPLAPMKQRSPAAMVNLLGDLWAGGEPAWEAVLGDDSVGLHLYGKDRPGPGRKMGHLTVLAPTADEARTRVLRARQRLARVGEPSPAERRREGVA